MCVFCRIGGRRASTHGEDGGARGGWGGGSGILNCLHAISEVGVKEKTWEALESITVS